MTKYKLLLFESNNKYTIKIINYSNKINIKIYNDFMLTMNKNFKNFKINTFYIINMKIFILQKIIIKHMIT